ncbi:UDP-glucosyltransferase 2-like [Nymphalis io]|uniref:UDP-glucosyltransferase 2-like n=1 Tax=Inachis io TaxID=171585 RepID=UPI002169B95B|nr:UDP-glucosyltransferase 2-like [Nymphalis io]
MSWVWSVIALSVIATTGIESARILAYFPTPSISHQIVFRHITKELARRGHEVTVVTTDPMPTEQVPANMTEIDVHDVSYKHWEELFLIHKGKKQDVLNQMNKLFEKLATVINIQMETPNVRKVLRNKDKKYFDLLLLEAICRPLIGLAHMFDAPIITISSFGAVPHQYEIFGAPMHPLIYPTPGSFRSYNLNLWEKGFELMKYFISEYMISSTKDFDVMIMKKTFGNDVPTIEELAKRIQMLFLNEHPIWAENHPIPPSIVFIGGIHQSGVKELPNDLKNYLDSSKHGVIYVSFGTNVDPSLLPPEKIEIMTKVFSQLKYNILWKWNNDDLPALSNNTKTSRWFPQSDLLRHPNVKLFITQGGLQSTDETINAGVPVIGIPMLGDQWYNAEKFVHHKIGIQLEITTLTEKEFKDAIITAIEDKSYKNNIIKLRALMREFPIKPLDNAIWWIEHVIKHGGQHLQSPAARMSWAEYYEIKLVLIALAISLVILVLLSYNETEHKLTEETIKQKIKALAGRIKRYEDKNNKKQQNKMFIENEHRLQKFR